MRPLVWTARTSRRAPSRGTRRSRRAAGGRRGFRGSMRRIRRCGRTFSIRVRRGLPRLWEVSWAEVDSDENEGSGSKGWRVGLAVADFQSRTARTCPTCLARRDWAGITRRTTCRCRRRWRCTGEWWLLARRIHARLAGPARALCTQSPTLAPSVTARPRTLHSHPGPTLSTTKTRTARPRSISRNGRRTAVTRKTCSRSRRATLP